ncbi:MAG: response regulator, partial [Bacteroidales bacterium]|nr:response regulator [Bacteroidales bacterium]
LFLFFITICESVGNPIQKIEVIDSRQGLSSDVVRSIYQDNDGFLWFLTPDGLNRYDGYTIKVFKPDFDKKDYFKTGDFHRACEDNDGNIWFSSYGTGINVYDKKNNKVKVISDQSEPPLRLSNNYIKSVYKDSRNQIWIANDYGIDRYSSETKSITHFNNTQRYGKFNPDGIIHRFYEESQGRILSSIWEQGLLVYNYQYDDFKLINLQKAANYHSIYIDRPIAFVEDDYGHIWIGTWEAGLLKAKLLNDSTIKILNHFTYDKKNKNGLLGNIIFSLNKDQNGNIWVGTPYGLNIIPNPEDDNPIFYEYTVETEKQVSSNGIKHIFRDNSGVMWLGTYGGGINKIVVNKTYFPGYTIPKVNEQIQSQVCKSFYEDGNGDLFVGIRSLGFGLYHLDKKLYTPYQQLKQFKNLRTDINTINCFYRDSRNNLWLGSRYFGVFKVENKTHKVSNFIFGNPALNVESRRINVITEDKLGCIWIGTHGGLYKLIPEADSHSYRQITFIPNPENPFSIESYQINALCISNSNDILIGTNDKGFSISISDINNNVTVAFKNFSAIANNSIIESNTIHDIEQINDSLFMIATDRKGIYLFDSKNQVIQQPDNSINLSDISIYSIQPDHLGYNWLSTNKGLFQISLDIENNSIEAQNYTYYDGLQSDIFIRNASLQLSNGNLIFGGFKGFNVITPDSIQLNKQAPPLVYTKIKKSGSEVNITNTEYKQLSLSHKDVSFSVEFSALAYSKPKSSIYFYKLVGFDKQWKETNYLKREINYTNLNPGKYKFGVYASNMNDGWKTETIWLDIVVKPAPSKTWWAYTIYVIIIILILAIIYSFNIKSIKIKQAFEIEKVERQESEKINQFKFRFFTNISHELLTPLSVISFAMEDFINHKNTSPDNLKAIQRNITRLMKLISQLLDFRKMETGNMQLNVQKNNCNIFFTSLHESLNPMALQKGIKLSMEGNISKPVFFDTDKLEKITVNLITNAIKYSPNDSVVEINYQLINHNSHEHLQFSVKDSGKGIDEDEIEHVFDRFYRVKSVTGKTFGAGIGLALTKNLTEVHHGSIDVQNRPNGAIFTVTIPIDETSYKQEEISGNEMLEDFNISNQISESTDYLDELPQELALSLPSTKKQSVLIVEDNRDFRSLLVRYLKNFFDVYEAENGKEGLELANQKYPNLIISDVMMPVMDGITMCQQLKGNIESCHIMVILLTAKVGEEAKYEGYKSGADSYICKPVNIKVLGARIESLIVQRNKLIEKIGSGYFPHNIENTKMSDIDKTFVEKLISLLENNLSNHEYNVARLREDMSMSNSALYRKMTSLLEKSPVEFMREFRLNKAGLLLKAKNHSVSEVAYQCGFNDLSYFSNCFKKQFGVLPSEYTK